MKDGRNLEKNPVFREEGGAEEGGERGGEVRDVIRSGEEKRGAV